jgi:hypothetical protein
VRLARAAGRVFALLVVLAAFGCASARWDFRRHEAGFALPSEIVVYLDVSAEVAAVDDLGFVVTMLDTLENELRERGIAPELVTPSRDAPPLPRLDVLVREMDEGSRLARYMTGVIGGSSMVVECVVFDAEGNAKFAGSITGSLIGGGHIGDPGGDPRGAAEAVGAAIAKAVTRYN